MNPSPYTAPSSSPSAPMLDGPPPQFAPLPLRPRNAMETLDVAVKLFKQFWKPLLAWSVLVNLSMAIPGLNYVAILFAPPMMMGVVGCCLAAAVRGQMVDFKQCSAFARPRYWGILAMHVLSGIVASFILITLTILGLVILGFLSEPLGVLFNDRTTFGIVAIFTGIVVLTLLWSVFLSALLTWQSLTNVVACMEDDSSGSAMVRAWRLLGGHWRLAINVTFVLGLGLMALWAILGGTASLLFGFTGLRDSFTGYANSDSGFIGLMTGFLVSMWALNSLYMPIHYIATTLLYLDLRVRGEALDLEWTAHQNVPAGAAQSIGNSGENTVVPAAFAPIRAQLTHEPLNSPFVTTAPIVAQPSFQTPEPSPFETSPFETSPFETSPFETSPTAVFEAPKPVSTESPFAFNGDSIPPTDTPPVTPQPSSTPFADENRSDDEKRF